MQRFFYITFIFIGLFCLSANAQVVVTLDYYFNHETHLTPEGTLQRFHYLWEDNSNTGFSVLGEAFKKQGAVLKSLDEAPTASNLKGTGIYIIVDPDSKKENADPKYIRVKNIVEIERWVYNGGVLLIMANDSANAELPHFNHLAIRFGMRFKYDLQNHVLDDSHFEDGAVITIDNPIFKTAKKIFLKDVCSITLRDPAKPALLSNGVAIMAWAKYGKGFVMAVGDPWLYNEYTNGRLPADFENNKAADDLAAYLIKQVK
jgi:hypothetical protein